MNKKLKKFIRSPNEFFLDFFYKRINNIPRNEKMNEEIISLPNGNCVNSGSQMLEKVGVSKELFSLFCSAIIKNRSLDVIFSVDEWVFDLLKYLCTNTCLVIYAGKDAKGQHRIFCNVDQIGYVHKLIREYRRGDLMLFSNQDATRRLQREKVLYAFYDDSAAYLSGIIELDPWFKGEEQIFSYNENRFVNRVDKRFLNKTVYSSHPLVLQGDYSVPDFESISGIGENIFSKMNFPVDVVFLWVDGNDESWRVKREEYFNKYSGCAENNSSARYYQMDEIRYSLRSIAYYMKFIRNIFIITDDQIPWWLDLEDQRIKIIDHKSLINSKVLPTFNSHVIESFIHKIPGLSENFIYFNDDVFVWRPMTVNDFFTPGGISLSRLEKVKNVYGIASDLQPAWKNAAINSNELLAGINFPYAPSYHQHVPMALKKSVLEEMESVFFDKYQEFRINKFRAVNDISAVSFLYHYYAIFSGRSISVETNSLTINSANSKSLDALSKKSFYCNFDYDFLCINDGGEHRNSAKVLNVLNGKFHQRVDWEILA